jgi:hypothetical protein
LVTKGLTFKANSHIPCRAPAIPVTCRSAKDLDCLSHLIHTVRPCLIHTYHSAPVPLPCHVTTIPFCKRFLKATAQSGMDMAWERHGICELASAVQRRHVGYLPAFGFFQLPRGVPQTFYRKQSSSSDISVYHAGFNKINNNNNILFTAIGLSPGGSGTKK